VSPARSRPRDALGWAASLICASLLSACAPAVLAPPPTEAPPREDVRALTTAPTELQGQIGIKLGAWQGEPPRGMSFGFFFQGHVERGNLSLMTPLGSQIAQIDWNPEGASLRRLGPGGGEEIRRGHIDELAQAAIGEPLPLQTLVHWMQGRPDPSEPHEDTPEAGVFLQGGWQIDARERGQGRVLATRQGQAGLRDARIQIRLDL
jgi:outer membrane lipoprotein LolB